MEEYKKALKCLYLEVDKSVALDVAQKVETKVCELRDRIKILEKDYSELMMAVSEKYPNETRHETALRYLQEAEISSGPFKVQSNKEPPKQD